jgi:hypothetical protein
VRVLPVKVFVVLGGLLVAGAAVLAAVLLRPDAGAQPSAEPSPPATSFPAPPRGAVVFSRQLGSDALALGIVPHGRRLLVQASVVGQQGNGVSGLDVGFTVGAASRSGAPCGAGCYRATVAATARPRAVDVQVRGTTPGARWHVALPSLWPPPDATGLVARAERAWRSLHSLSFREALASDPRPPLMSTWRVQAPDRVAYQVLGGWAGIIVGAHRWDRPPGGARWAESVQTPVTQPVPGWVEVADAHLLGSTTVQGRPAWHVSFFDPRTPAWFTIAIDTRTLHTLDVHMIATAHFMHDVYGAFDAAPPIEPPR